MKQSGIVFEFEFPTSFYTVKVINQAKIHSTIHLKNFNGTIYSRFLTLFRFGIRYPILFLFDLRVLLI
ncbi:hypothetical protein B2G51_15205 [Leptospira santarosai]|nr:hypothetical protein B2G51_15205 [Leptospira santarosai]